MGKYERKGILTIKEFEEKFKDVILVRLREKEINNAMSPSFNGKIEVFGEMIKPFSLRYENFIKNGYKCKSCGIKGTFFALERDVKKHECNKFRLWHLNLYALDKDGKEILMTRDHVIPKCYGGKEDINNMTTMCSPCNSNKADSLQHLRFTKEFIQKNKKSLKATYIKYRNKFINISNIQGHYCIVYVDDIKKAKKYSSSEQASEILRKMVRAGFVYDSNIKNYKIICTIKEWKKHQKMENMKTKLQNV